MEKWPTAKVMDALKGSDEKQRNAAAEELVRRGPEVIPELLEAGFDVPIAIDCLARMGKPGLRPIILEFLQSKAPKTCAVAMAALVRIGKPATSPLLKESTKPGGFHNRELVMLCLKRQGPDVLPELIPFATSKHQDPVRSLIYSYGPDAVPHIETLVKSEDPEDRLTAAKLVNSIGEPALPLAIVLLEDPDLTVYKEICQKPRGYFGFRAVELIPALQKACQHQDSYRAGFARSALGTITDDPKVMGPIMFEAIKDRRVSPDTLKLAEEYISQFEDKAEILLDTKEPRVIRYVGNMSDETVTRLVPRLIEFVKEGDRDCQYAAFNVLCQKPEFLEAAMIDLVRHNVIGKQGAKIPVDLRARMLFYLVTALESDDEALGDNAGNILAFYTQEDFLPARKVVMEGLTSENDAVVIRILRGLSSNRFDEKETMGPMIELLDHSNVAVRFNAIRTISGYYMWGDEAADKMNEILPDEPDKQNRRWMENTLDRWNRN